MMIFDKDYSVQDYVQEEVTAGKQMRERAWQFLKEKGIPKKSEVWKYTDMNKFLPASSQLLTVNVQSDLDRKAQIKALTDPHQISVVFVDGRLDEHSSDIDALFDAGAYIRSILSHSETRNYDKDHFMLALNDAAHTDGVIISVDQALSIPKPIELIYVATEASSGAIHNYKNQIELKSDASVSVNEKFHHITNDNASVPMFNIQTEVFLQSNAQLSLDLPILPNQAGYSLVHAVDVKLAKASAFHYTNVALKSGFNRFDVNVHLNEDEAVATVNGATVAAEQAHTDHHIFIRHNASHTTSDVKYRMMATDKASATFNAKAYVKEGVKGIKAFQSNKNILLTNTAEINTKPELEIYADDVVCTHGATVGQLDETAIYYIMSRGIARENAEKLLTESFIVEGISENNAYQDEYHKQIVEVLDDVIKHNEA